MGRLQHWKKPVQVVRTDEVRTDMLHVSRSSAVAEPSGSQVPTSTQEDSVGCILCSCLVGRHAMARACVLGGVGSSGGSSSMESRILRPASP
mmetsp:Transcript_39748/g.78596  ORF Transcript_39748/g.78596 Transcript_39748/m.78596 type:complete len:92 (-) Transcript_39748:28-303(-)